MDSNELWGKHVAAIREKYNLSQEELANRIGTNQTTISRWERRLSKPTYRLQKKISELFEPADSRDAVSLEMIYEIAQQFVFSQPQKAKLFDRDFVLRAVNTPDSLRKSLIGRHMAACCDPWEAQLVAPFETLLGNIGFWDQPNTCWVYHNPYPLEGYEPLKTFRLVLTCIDISGESFLLLTHHFRTGEKFNGVTATQLSAPEPFDPLPWELHLPIDMLVQAVKKAEN